MGKINSHRETNKQNLYKLPKIQTQWKGPKCHSTNNQINAWQYMNLTEYYSAIEMKAY